MSEFAIRLRKALEERSMNQSELSKKTGIRQSSISDYLNDRYEPKQDKVEAIANALDVSPSYLMGVDNDEDNLTMDGKFLLDALPTMTPEKQKKLKQLYDFIISE